MRGILPPPTPPQSALGVRQEPSRGRRIAPQHPEPTLGYRVQVLRERGGKLVEYVTLALPAPVGRTETPPHWGPDFSASCPCCWETQPPQHPWPTDTGAPPRHPERTSCNWGRLVLPGSQSLCSPPTPSRAPRSQAKRHSVLRCWGPGAVGGSAQGYF